MEINSHTFVKRKFNPSIKDFLMYISDNPHKNFPVIAEVCDDYYTMEYIEGVSLSDLVNDSPLSQSVAKEYMLQLLDATELMHKFKIVHRDIKPENIIVTNDGIIKLIDFDISRKIITSKNCDTHLLGTAGYAAPEQYGFTQTDERSDIYAIGIVYNFMLTGKAPLEKSIFGETGKIISKCTRLDKEYRYKSIERLRRDIKKERFTSYRLFDIIPGFRTGNIYKMIIAVLAYITFFTGYFILACEEAPRVNIEDITMFYIVLAVIILYNFLFFSVAVNFLGIIDRLKLPVESKNLKRILYLILIFVLGCLVCYSIFGNVRDALMYNPISVTFLLFGYLFYSITEPFLIGML